MDISVVSTFQLLWPAPLWSLTYELLSVCFRFLRVYTWEWNCSGHWFHCWSSHQTVSMPKAGEWQISNPRGWHSEWPRSKLDEFRASRIDVSVILNHLPILSASLVVQTLCWWLCSFYLINSLLPSLWYLFKCPLSSPHASLTEATTPSTVFFITKPCFFSSIALVITDISKITYLIWHIADNIYVIYLFTPGLVLLCFPIKDVSSARCLIKGSSMIPGWGYWRRLDRRWWGPGVGLWGQRRS